PYFVPATRVGCRTTSKDPAKAVINNVNDKPSNTAISENHSVNEYSAVVQIDNTAMIPIVTTGDRFRGDTYDSTSGMTRSKDHANIARLTRRIVCGSHNRSATP